MQKECSQVFTHIDFYQSLLADLRGAVARVLICSPYITSGRLRHIVPELRACVLRGVRVCVFLQKRRRRAGESADDSMLEVAINQLVQSGVHVNLREGMHEKLCIIDDRILWEGSLNALSHFDTTERARRWISHRETGAAVRLHQLNNCTECSDLYGRSDDPVAKRMERLGAALAKARKQRGLSQTELARITGVSQRIISLIENGHDARTSTILRLCEHLDSDLCVVRTFLIPVLADFDSKLP